MEEYIEELKKENKELKVTIKEYEEMVKELNIDLTAKNNSLIKIKEEVEYIL